MENKRHHHKKWMPIMYVTYFGILKDIALFHGYTLCVHGSGSRDFDLIFVPFEEKISTHEEVIISIKNAVGIEHSSDKIFDLVGHEPHGRTCYTIECGAGGYFDISFTPTMKEAMEKLKEQALRETEIQELLNKVKQNERTTKL